MKINNIILDNNIESFNIAPDEGKALQRKSDGLIILGNINLGYTYYIDGVKLESPILEKPEDYEEIDYIIQEDPSIKEPTEEELIERKKNSLLMEITNYDSSNNVNVFYLNDEPIWLPKADRVGLMNSINIEKQIGRETSTMWFNGKSYTVNCDLAIQLLTAIELYALQCYNITEHHKFQVNQLESLRDLNAYDITKNYPEPLHFDI